MISVRIFHVNKMAVIPSSKVKWLAQNVASFSLAALLTNYIYQTRNEKHVTKVTIKWL